MEDPYILTGSALDKFQDNFDLIDSLLENQNDESVVFDLAWLPEPEHKQLFKDLAEGRQIGTVEDGKLHLFKPYTKYIIERFITYMGYGRSGMGTKYLTKERATPEQAAASYAKARNAMFENFKKNFALNIPRGTLGHGDKKPRAEAVRNPRMRNPKLFHYWPGQRFYFNNDDKPTQREKRERHALGLHITNNNATHGKLAGKKSLKSVRKGMPTMKTRKIKKWTHNNNKE